MSAVRCSALASALVSPSHSVGLGLTSASDKALHSTSAETQVRF